jgi:aspartate kinase
VIYTDVPGILTADPRLVPDAQLMDEITSDEMLELASLGAKVLHPVLWKLRGITAFRW